MLGTEQGAKAPADGYTLTLASAGALIIAPALSKSGLKYHAEKDFIPIGGLARSAFVVVTADTPEAPHTFQELVSRLKEKGGNFASPGAGTTTHLVGEILLQKAGVKATHVPYRGSSQSLTDTAAGHVVFAFDTVAGALPLVQGGKLRALAVPLRNAWHRCPTFRPCPKQVCRVTASSAGGASSRPRARPRRSSKAVGCFDARCSNTRGQEQARCAGGRALPAASAGFASLISKEMPMWTNLVRENKLSAD